MRCRTLSGLNRAKEIDKTLKVAILTPFVNTNRPDMRKLSFSIFLLILLLCVLLASCTEFGAWDLLRRLSMPICGSMKPGKRA